MPSVVFMVELMGIGSVLRRAVSFSRLVFASKTGGADVDGSAEGVELASS